MNKALNTKALLTAAALMLLSAGAVAAEDPAESFKTLFGEQLAKVKYTATLADDVKLAGEIIQIAGSNKLDDALLVVMYNNAFELASRSVKGHDVAFDAMEKLSEAVPAEKAASSRKSLTLHLKRFQMARRTADRKALVGPYVQALMQTARLVAAEGNIDSAIAYSRKALTTSVGFKLSGVADIRSYNSQLMAKRTAAKRLQLLETKLKTDPSDAETRKKLIDLHLIDRDDPVAASKLLSDDCDEMLRTYVALAAQPMDKIETPSLSELGRWYVQLADDAPRASQAPMLRRAEQFYLRYLDVYAEKDTKRLKVSLALASVRRKLAKLGKSAAESSGPVSSGSWPGSSRGLLFAWRDSSATIKLTPRGKAKIAKDKSMSVGRGAFIAPGSINTKLLAACKKTNALTIEAMIKTDSLKQSGPARIISFSQDGQQRNFTVGQEDGSLVFRLRTTSSADQNTTMPLLTLTDGKWQHVVIAYGLEKGSSSSKTRGRLHAYLNGKAVNTTVKKNSGRLSGWASMHLLFGDEFAEKRDWSGQLKNIAIYARAITAKEAAAKAKALGMLAAEKK